MLNFNRRDQAPDLKSSPGKIPLKPALYDAPEQPARTTSSTTSKQMVSAPAPAVHDAVAHTGTRVTTPVPAATPATTTAPASAAAQTGSQLSVGVNIHLKGVEISNCDALVIEGQVEATVHSKSMQIDKPGTLTGTALIDVAEIHGEFSGDLTARTRLVVHGTGRVSGTIRYGKLVVAEGGELTGDVKRLESAEDQAQGVLPVTRDPHA